GQGGNNGDAGPSPPPGETRVLVDAGRTGRTALAPEPKKGLQVRDLAALSIYESAARLPTVSHPGPGSGPPGCSGHGRARPSAKFGCEAGQDVAAAEGGEERSSLQDLPLRPRGRRQSAMGHLSRRHEQGGAD